MSTQYETYFKKDREIIDNIKVILSYYDDGFISSASCVSRISRLMLERVVESVKTNDIYWQFSSVCTREPPKPLERLLLCIEHGPFEFRIYKALSLKTIKRMLGR